MNILIYNYIYILGDSPLREGIPTSPGRHPRQRACSRCSRISTEQCFLKWGWWKSQTSLVLDYFWIVLWGICWPSRPQTGPCPCARTGWSWLPGCWSGFLSGRCRDPGVEDGDDGGDGDGGHDDDGDDDSDDEELYLCWNIWIRFTENHPPVWRHQL